MCHFAIGCFYCVHLRLYNPFPEASFKSLLKAIVVLNMCNLICCIDDMLQNKRQ